MPRAWIVVSALKVQFPRRPLSGADLKRKWSGADMYKTKFNRTRIKEFPFVASVRDNPYR